VQFFAKEQGTTCRYPAWVESCFTQGLHLAALQASGGPEHQTFPEAPTDVPRLEPGDKIEDQKVRHD